MLQLYTLPRLTRLTVFLLTSAFVSGCSIEGKSSQVSNELDIPEATSSTVNYPPYPHNGGYVRYGTLSRSGQFLIGKFSSSKAQACLEDAPFSYIPEGEFNNLISRSCVSGGNVMEFSGGGASDCTNYAHVQTTTSCGAGSLTFLVEVYNFHPTETIEIEYSYQYSGGDRGTETLILGPNSTQKPRCATWAGMKSCSFK